MWKPQKKAPPPPEMPGLGTATLPLTSKSEHHTPPLPHSTPPFKTSPQSATRMHANLDLSNFHTPPERNLRPIEISPDMHMHDPGMEFIPMTISPHEVMHAATVNYFQSPTQLQDQAGRPCSRAQSFDDFLRLHRFQDRETAAATTAPVLSAPLSTTELPQMPQHHHVNSMEHMQDPPHDGWVQHPYAPSYNSYGAPHGVNNAVTPSLPTQNIDGMSHFPVIDLGEYDQISYNDVSWQQFMNGLEL